MSMKDKLNILILEDDKRLLEELSEYLVTNSYSVYMAEKPSAAMTLIYQHAIDIAIIDIRLPEYSGIDFLKKMKKSHSEIEAIMISGHGDADIIIEALRFGAYDFLQKPFAPMDIKVAIERTSKYTYLQKKTVNLEAACRNLQDEIMSTGGIKLIGVSAAIKDTVKRIKAASEYAESPVLITGESGTGKELAARLIHFNSSRKTGRFIPVNCAAVPEFLCESEFFGHTKGAFTNSLEPRKGFFRTADKGTLFLDEIGDMPYLLQAKLLRIVEEKKVKPVGSDKEISADPRIICATNSKLDNLLANNKFRLDLYHRISVFDIHIPPLRERPEDISVLAVYFLDNLCRKMGRKSLNPDSDSLKALSEYDFPGNVRELRNIVEKAVIMGSDPIVFGIPAKAPVNDYSNEKKHAPSNNSELPTLNIEELEKMAIQSALKNSAGNLTKAAFSLGISRQALDRRILKYDIVL